MPYCLQNNVNFRNGLIKKKISKVAVHQKQHLGLWVGKLGKISTGSFPETFCYLFIALSAVPYFFISTPSSGWVLLMSPSQCCPTSNLVSYRIHTITQGEMASHNLWSRYVRHFLGMTWHNVCSLWVKIHHVIQKKINQLVFKMSTWSLIYRQSVFK